MAWTPGWAGNERSGWLLQQEVFTIVTLDEAGIPHVAGCAAIISNQGRQAICLTARHIFQSIFNLQTSSRHRGPSFPVPDDRKLFDLTPWLDDKQVRAMCVIDGVGHLCDITSLCVLPPLDIAVIVVDVPKGNPAMFGEVLGLNSDPLPVGTEVILVSYKTQKMDRIDERTYNRDIAIRIGRITAVEISGSGLVRAPVYIMSMPADAGMSGAPVFIYDPTMQGPKQICGVISGDMSLPEAFEDAAVDGESVASLIWTAAALNVRDEQKKLVTLKELAERGHVKDFGSAFHRVILETLEGGKWSLSLG